MLSKLIFLLAVLPILSKEIKHGRVITTLKYSKFRVKPVIVNGAIARSGQLPYLVSFKEPIKRISVNKTVWSSLCGGSIIGYAKVLTAAHCFESKDFYYAKHPEALRVVAGCLTSDLTHSGETETTTKAQWRKIIHVTLHDGFNFPSNDIAIAFTDTPWNFTSRVNFIPPASTSDDYMKSCLSAGFGQTSRNYFANISKVLLWAEIDVFSRSQCNVLWEMDMDTFICTNSVATDVGGGDSGGPLACFAVVDTEGSTVASVEEERDLLVGIVSGKNFDKTTLFTRVSAFSNWLSKNSGTCLKGSAVVGLCFVIKFVCNFLLFIVYLFCYYSSRCIY